MKHTGRCQNGFSVHGLEGPFSFAGLRPRFRPEVVSADRLAVRHVRVAAAGGGADAEEGQEYDEDDAERDLAVQTLGEVQNIARYAILASHRACARPA